MLIQKKPRELNALLQKLGNDSPKIIGRNLVGVYIYGSLTYKAFNKKTSDIDCVAVIKRALNNSEYKKLSAWYRETAKINPWTKKFHDEKAHHQ